MKFFSKKRLKFFVFCFFIMPLFNIIANANTANESITKLQNTLEPTPYIEKLQGTWFSLLNASRIQMFQDYPWSIHFPDEDSSGKLNYLPEASSERYAVYSIRVGSRYSNLRLDKSLPGALEYGSIDTDGVFTVFSTYIRNFLNDERNVKNNPDPEQMFDGNWKSVDQELTVKIYKNDMGHTKMHVNGPDVGGGFYLDLYWYTDAGWKGYGGFFAVAKKDYIDPYTHEKKEALIVTHRNWRNKTYVMLRQ